MSRELCKAFANAIVCAFILVIAATAANAAGGSCPAGTCSPGGITFADDVKTCAAANCRVNCPPGQIVSATARGGRTCIVPARDFAGCVANGLRNGFTPERSRAFCRRIGFRES